MYRVPSAHQRPTAGYNNPTHRYAPRSASPRTGGKPDFREGSTLEEKDRAGRVVTKHRVGRLLGRGGFAKCYAVTDGESGKTLALKVIERASLNKNNMLQKLHSEIAIHKRMKHKNIVNFIRNFQDDWNYYILLEKCSNQTLMEVAKARRRFSVAETQFIMIQSLSAMQYMHENNVIHRDLKLGNMMMDSDMNVKIGDFGLAAELSYDGERKRTVCGTPNYIAPEILEGHRNGHSFEADVWSLGVILYTLLVGEPPFQTSDVKTTYSRIKQCRYTFPVGVDIPESGKNLIHRILQSRPENRPTLMDMRMDPFFKYPSPPSVAPLSLFPHDQRCQRERDQAVLEQMAPNVAHAVGGKGLGVVDQNEPRIAKKDVKEAATGDLPRAFSARSSKPTGTQEPAAPNTARGTTAAALPRRNTAPIVPPSSAGATAWTAPSAETPTAWMTDYADFSAKYGMAYRLCTGHTGAYFNDATKMLLDPVTSKVDYFGNAKESFVHKTFDLESFPEDLKKKITLIKHFRSQIDRSRAAGAANAASSSVPVVSCSTPSSSPANAATVHLKQWLAVEADGAMAFRLSNRTVHVCFKSTSSTPNEVIVSPEAKTMSFVDESGKWKMVPLTSLSGQPRAVASKLQKALDIVDRLAQNRQ